MAKDPRALEHVPSYLLNVRRPEWMRVDPWALIDYWPEDVTLEQLANNLGREPIVTAHDAVGVAAMMAAVKQDLAPTALAWVLNEKIYRVPEWADAEACANHIPNLLAWLILKEDRLPTQLVALGPVLPFRPGFLPGAPSRLSNEQRLMLDGMSAALTFYPNTFGGLYERIAGSDKAYLN